MQDKPSNAETEIKGNRRQAERRRYSRYTVSASLEGVELQSKARFTGRISDLSLGGCYVDTITIFNVGATVKIRFTRDDKYFESKAKVTTSTAGMGMGLIFTETEPEHVETLEGWFRELSGELSPSEAELPEIRAPEIMESSTNVSPIEALSELVVELMRTGVLSELKGNGILQKISRR